MCHRTSSLIRMTLLWQWAEEAGRRKGWFDASVLGRRVIGAVLVAFVVSITAAAREPVQLAAYPQKVRTFYGLNDTNVPAGLHSNAVPLPLAGITVAVRASDGATWLGTTQGLMRLDFASVDRDQRQYLAGLRYLPDDYVHQMLPDEHAGVWVRTRTGVSHIELRWLTLANKAELFEDHIRLRHDRYGLTASSHLEIAGDLSRNRTHDNDNDGLWTAIYAAAECFRYAATKSPEALVNARKALDAILFLEEVAGQRGFPARSFIRKGDPMPHGGEWHWTTDGRYYWKGDTSSDEIAGHFFVFSIAYALLPDAELKKRIVETARRIMDHIIDHGYNLVGLDGKPTEWGFWGPERLAREPDERALNSIQLLSFLKTTAHLTGDARYEKEYIKVAWDFKYADWLTRLNEFRQELNYSDEELAMFRYYCLFQYEKDPALLKAYRSGADQWWQNIQRELNPLWTFIYLSGQPGAKVDLAGAVRTLYRMPVDT